MANLDNLTDDEKLLIILVLNQEALLNKVIELTKSDCGHVEKTLGLATAKCLKSLTDSQLKELLDSHRANALVVEQLANKHSRATNN